MTIPNGYVGLHFPCECVSALDQGYSDPWAEITKRKLLPNGTKEQILNLVSEEPKTISQLAQAVGIAPASVHSHINELMKSELLRESIDWEKQYPTERYYEPNFPVFKAAECAQFRSVCTEMAEEIAAVFERKQAKLKRAFDQTGLADKGWDFSEVTQCLFANMQRHARTLLEEHGLLKAREKHANGANWIFWAQEEMNVKKTSAPKHSRSKRAQPKPRQK
jgi:DNA-binding transcriptional ArsR family regulator